MSENCAARFVTFAILIVVLDCFIGLLPSVFRAWIVFVSFAILIVVLDCFICVERVTYRVAALDCVCIEELPWFVCLCVNALAIVVQWLFVFASCF